MALFDLQPMDLPDGSRQLPSVSIGVIFDHDKGKARPDQRSIETDINYRKIFKTSQIELVPAKYKKVNYPINETYVTVSRPNHFIKNEVKAAEEIEDTVEYDADEEDLVWLEEENKKREQKKKKKIKDETFELTIDRLEKETYFQSEALEACSMDGSESLDDDCCICGNGDVENINQIIYCDMCNIAVHQDCYGVPYIPEGQWLCRKCKLSPMEAVKCELCPLRTGAFKPTTDGKWAHVSCAIWLNEVHFGNTAFLEPIEGVGESLRRRCKLRCLVCKIKVGACLQCSKGSCVKAFHVTCAMKARLQMQVDTVENKKSPDGVDVKRFVYCHVHGSVAVGENEFAKNKKKAIEAIHKARKVLNTVDSATPSAPIPTVDAEAKKRIEARIGEKNILEDVQAFWFYKRKKRYGLPLIRRLQAKKKNVVRVQTPHEEASRRGRIMYEKARLLIELMKKREKNYLENIMYERKMFPALLAPLNETLVEFITNIIPLDVNKFFRDDPLKQGLLHYTSIVKKPMDFTTMKRNAKNGMYKTEGEMKEHLDLVFNNCELFNKGNDGVLIYCRDIEAKTNRAYYDLVDYLKFMRRWNDELKLNGEKKSDIKEEVKEEQKELREQPTARDEPNRRKRKGSEMKEEDVPDTPTSKREKRTRDKDKDRQKEKEKESIRKVVGSSSVFAPSTLASFFPRRASIDSTRLDSNSNKPRRMLTRNSTQPFMTFRDLPAVLSPEMGGMTSCDSAVESDVEQSRPDNLSYLRSTLADPNSFEHNDKVTVNGKEGRIVWPTHERVENPDIMRVYSALKSDGPNDVLVHFESGRPEYARYKRSCVVLVKGTDKDEGNQEIREYRRQMVSSN